MSEQKPAQVPEPLWLRDRAKIYLGCGGHGYELTIDDGPAIPISDAEMLKIFLKERAYE